MQPAENQAELETIERLLAQRHTLLGRVAAARASAGTLEQLEQENAAGLESESRRLARLEHLSLTRLVSTLRGRRAEELDAARTAERVAETRLAASRERRTAAHSDIERMVREIDAMGDLDARRAAALTAREDWLRHSDPVATALLDEVAVEIGARHETLREVGEAEQAARDAQHWLDAAAGRLDSARGWSTYDTFFGGGSISSMVKHDRMDDASDLIRRADAAMTRLSHELADIDLAPVGGVAVSSLTRGMDIWFDNLLSDLFSRDAILRAIDRVSGAQRTVADVLSRLADQRTDAERELEALTGRRVALLES